MELPAEIWHCILDAVVKDDELFDPNSVLHCLSYLRYDFERRWKTSERQRNTLRRVCKSWMSFLDSRADFIIIPGKLPAQHSTAVCAIPADRIRILSYDIDSLLDCRPPSFYNPNITIVALSDPSDGDGMVTHIRPASFTSKTVKFLEDVGLLPRLVSLTVTASFYHPEVFGLRSLSSGLPRLRSLRLHQYSGTLTDTHLQPVHFPCLEILEYRAIVVPNFDSWIMPALKHFVFEGIHAARDAIAVGTFIMTKIGTRLETLGWNSMVFEPSAQENLWEECPNIKTILTRAERTSIPLPQPGQARYFEKLVLAADLHSDFWTDPFLMWSLGLHVRDERYVMAKPELPVITQFTECSWMSVVLFAYAPIDSPTIAMQIEQGPKGDAFVYQEWVDLAMVDKSSVRNMRDRDGKLLDLTLVEKWKV